MGLRSIAIDNKQVKRRLWLDALRGVAMILVVYGHCVGGKGGWDEYFVFTSPVKMPLFFAISGYLFNPRSGNQMKFFKNLFLKLIVPWIVLGMFPYTHPVERFFSLLAGTKFWFMPCLIIAEVLWFYIHKVSKSTVQTVILGLLACAAGFSMHYFHILHYAMTNTAFIVQAFFILGLLIRKNEDLLCHHWRIWVPVSALSFIVMGGVNLVLWPAQSLDVHQNLYFNIPFCAIEIVVGCATLFTLFLQLEISPKWLVYIGQNTLLIYMLHGIGLGISRRLFHFLPIIHQLPLPVKALLLTSFAITLCCVLAVFVNKYAPAIVGKKSK